MRRLGSSIAILLLCATTARAQDVLALRSATVIDSTSASPRERITILIRGERIVAVGPDGRVPIPPEATVLDATGRWVIPGLVEVHTHSTARPRLAQALALGVTSALVIAPSDSFLALGPWSAEPSSAAPRVFVTPGGFTGAFPEPFVHSITLVRPATPGEARQAVDALTARGARQFKIWQDDGSLWSLTDMRLPTLTPEVLSEIVRASHQRKARVYAHAWRVRDARAVLNAGVDAIIHPIADSILEPALLRRFADGGIATATTWAGLMWLFNRSAFARRILADERLIGVLPDSARAGFARDTEPPVRTDSLWPRLEGYRATLYRNAHALLNAGAPLAVGSDGPVGLATHLEMELMVEGGFTPREVLVAATAGGAQLLGLSREVGTIEAGKRADLVVLRSNPLDDIRNARDVEWTIKGGRPFAGTRHAP